MSKILKEMGFEAMGQDQCVSKATPIPGKPPIYLGLYVDDFVYYSTSDEVEAWFEQGLQSKVKVDFLGTVSWFLGQAYEWFTTSNNRVTCHISQEAFVEQLYERNKLIEYKPSCTPYCSGYVIDRVSHDGIDPLQKPELVKAFQQILGGLNWLTINTRPDYNVATKLLGQFKCDPSIGHLNSAKCVLQYLRSTSSHGIWFTQGDERLWEMLEYQVP